ncbi:MAG: CRTAC1 family protein [Rhodospirillales bacterium]|nr:CRTAC1 family protein [Rhodospirillales bacterium]MBO6788194.1 CRTAC1 family protein [Rhodospirillales bacterium]
MKVVRQFGIGACLALGACLPRFEDDHISSAAPAVTAFEEIPVAFSHNWVEPSHPFTGAAVIDIDGDGRMELFVGGGRGQADALLGYRNGALVDLIEGTGLGKSASATHGAASSDLDGDGDVDLAVAHEDGLTVYINQGGRFEARDVPIQLPADSVPMSVSVSDINGDGFGDLYISVFVSFPAFRSATFNDPEHAKANIMLLNDGAMQFRDVTQQTGTASVQNTFHSTFVDLDQDGDQDLVLSQNTAELEVFERTGPMKFEARPTGTGYGFWMGLAIGDPDQDGDQDILVSNIGTSIPDFVTSGDLRDDQRQNTGWGYLRNDGAFKFTDIATAMNLDGYGFAWGAQFEDLNLDGEIDLLVAQNYIKWPLHRIAPLPGKALLRLNAPEGTAFYQVPGLGLDNTLFAQSPLIVDLDGDGRADVVWINMNGPVRAFLNKSPGQFLAVRLPDSPRTLGAHVTVALADGRKLTRQVIASTGLMTDPTPDLHFGLGDASSIERVTLHMPSGSSAAIEKPAVNSTVTFALEAQ